MAEHQAKKFGPFGLVSTAMLDACPKPLPVHRNSHGVLGNRLVRHRHNVAIRHATGLAGGPFRSWRIVDVASSGRQPAADSRPCVCSHPSSAFPCSSRTRGAALTEHQPASERANRVRIGACNDPDGAVYPRRPTRGRDARSAAARSVERARIVLMAATGLQDREIAATLKITPEKAARWRNRFLDGGVAALEKDAQRPGRTPAITAKKVREVIRRTTQEKPDNATHWSTRTMAKAVGLSEKRVRRIWHKHGLKPHLARTFKVSNDARFAEKLEAIIGLYLNPPEHAGVLRADEKSQIQALDRTNLDCP